MSNRLLTVRELSETLHLHPQTVYVWKKTGRLPFVILGGRQLRFDQCEVEKFISERKARSLLPTPPLDRALGDYDRVNLRRCKALSDSSGRWNYFSLGSIIKRKTKKGADRWYLDYRSKTGERIREIVPEARTRSEALRTLHSRIFQKAAQGQEGKKGSLPFSEFSRLYLEDYAKVKKRSWKTDKGCIEGSMMRFFGENPLSEITPLDVERYIKKRLSDGVTKTTVNRSLQILRRMFNLACDWGYALSNPLKKIKLFSEQENLMERILSADEERRLLEASSEHLRPIIITALNTGLRRGEILNLRWREIDFENRLLKVARSKSGRQRFIEVNQVLLELLGRQRIQEPRSEFVFVNVKTGRPYVEVGKAFRAACRRAQIKGLRFHDLRHTFASRLIEAGVDIITVRDLLGHSSVKLTERYTHARNEQKRRAVEILAERANGAAGWSNLGQTAEEKRAAIPPSYFLSMN